MANKSDLLQGTLDLLILRRSPTAPMHGWGISLRIQQVSEDVLQVNQGSLYPALHRLEQQGLIDAEWGNSENNRQAKFYQLTRAAESSCRRDRNWERLPRGRRECSPGNPIAGDRRCSAGICDAAHVALPARPPGARSRRRTAFHVDMLTEQHVARRACRPIEARRIALATSAARARERRRARYVVVALPRNARAGHSLRPQESAAQSRLRARRRR